MLRYLDNVPKITSVGALICLVSSIVHDWILYSFLNLPIAGVPASINDYINSTVAWSPNVVGLFIIFFLVGSVVNVINEKVKSNVLEVLLIILMAWVVWVCFAYSYKYLNTESISNYIEKGDVKIRLPLMLTLRYALQSVTLGLLISFGWKYLIKTKARTLSILPFATLVVMSVSSLILTAYGKANAIRKNYCYNLYSLELKDRTTIDRHLIKILTHHFIIWNAESQTVEILRSDSILKYTHSKNEIRECIRSYHNFDSRKKGQNVDAESKKGQPED